MIITRFVSRRSAFDSRKQRLEQGCLTESVEPATQRNTPWAETGTVL